MIGLATVIESRWLTNGAKVVYSVLVRDAPPSGRLSGFSQRAIAIKSGLGYRSVRLHLNSLIECGLIERVGYQSYQLRDGDIKKLMSSRKD